MTKEEKYTQQLKEMGIWEDAFAGTVHDLAILEREQARTRKAWKETAEDGGAPSPLDPHYLLILQQGRDIDRLRDALGLTPKALRKLKGTKFENAAENAAQRQNEKDAEDAANVLDFVRAKYGA
ncbi:MAG: hypothetical protein IJ124_05965 [Clostridia bacterium]|nr:hypothetical protein [Clostridia bacterium]